ASCSSHQRFLVSPPPRNPLHDAPQLSWSKRQSSRYRSDHVLSFAGVGLPQVLMATTPKNRSKKSKVGRTASRVESVSQLKKTIASQEKTIASQETTIATQARELRQALEQQTATSQILGVIASSPTDIQPVLDVVAENAGRLCDANDTRIMRVEGDVLRPVAHYGPLPDAPRGEGTPISRGWPSGRAVVDGRMIHVHDLASEMETEFPESKIRQAFAGTRTMLVAPLLREGVPI